MKTVYMKHRDKRCCCHCQSHFQLRDIRTLKPTGKYICLNPDLMYEMGRVAFGFIGKHGSCECFVDVEEHK